jgi:hypothetical protein
MHDGEISSALKKRVTLWNYTVMKYCGAVVAHTGAFRKTKHLWFGACIQYDSFVVDCLRCGLRSLKAPYIPDSQILGAHLAGNRGDGIQRLGKSTK